jgi:type II secretory pathway component PulF
MNFKQAWLFATNQPEPLRQSALLMLLAGCVGHGDSLLHCLQAHAAESRGQWGSKISQLRMLLEQGYALSSAMGVVGELVPVQSLSAIRVAEGSGMLPDVLMDEARRISVEFRQRESLGLDLAAVVLMVSTVAVVGLGLLLFLSHFIVPKIRPIFGESGFGPELPALSQRLFSFCDFLNSTGLFLILPFLATLAVLAFRYQRSERMRLSQGFRPWTASWPRMWVPDLLRHLSLTAASGTPTGLALDSALEDLPHGAVTLRVSELRTRIQNGDELIAAMAGCRLIKSSEAAFLKSALRTRHLDWGLRHLAAAIERRRNRWLRGLSGIVAPLLIFGLSLAVLFVVAGLFMPLVKLISELSFQTAVRMVR